MPNFIVYRTERSSSLLELGNSTDHLPSKLTELSSQNCASSYGVVYKSKPILRWSELQAVNALCTYDFNRYLCTSFANLSNAIILPSLRLLSSESPGHHLRAISVPIKKKIIIRKKMLKYKKFKISINWTLKKSYRKTISKHACEQSLLLSHIEPLI